MGCYFGGFHLGFVFMFYMFLLMLSEETSHHVGAAQWEQLIAGK